MKATKVLWFIFWLLTGLIVGGLAASLCGGIPALRWLAYGESLSFSPAADLVILQFSLQLDFQMNLSQVICVLAALLCWRRFSL